MNTPDSLYVIDSSSKTPEGYLFDFHLDEGHVIYKAHFPGEPITPGACILDIALELLGRCAGKKLELSCAKNVKYLSILRPENARVQARIYKITEEDRELRAQLEFTDRQTPVAKMSLICRIAE